MLKIKSKNKLNLITLGLLLSSYLNTSFAELNSNTAWVIQAGGFTATQGKAQHVDINNLIGDDFSVSNSHAQNFLLGLGYYFKGLSFNKINLLYGLNAFYFAPTKVKGEITQEGLFTNLSYQYDLANYPIYLAGKALIQPGQNSSYNWSFNLGLGPNFIKTNSFSESSLDNGQTEPDNIFTGKTTVTLSAMAGFGLRINHAIAQLPIEIDYRFFYLGQGELKSNNSEVNNNLYTGHNYASALLISLCF